MSILFKILLIVGQGGLVFTGSTPKQKVIALLFTLANTVIFCWREK
jgi:hypothetical protein